MPKTKKNVKLRDQKPQSDPKGGKGHHHKKVSGGGTPPSDLDPTRTTPGLLP